MPIVLHCIPFFDNDGSSSDEELVCEYAAVLPPIKSAAIS